MITIIIVALVVGIAGIGLYLNHKLRWALGVIRGLKADVAATETDLATVTDQRDAALTRAHRAETILDGRVEYIIGVDPSTDKPDAIEYVARLVGPIDIQFRTTVSANALVQDRDWMAQHIRELFGRTVVNYLADHYLAEPGPVTEAAGEGTTTGVIR